jgi:hypothetical protein
MNTHTDFDFLAGIVRVDMPAPETWKKEGLVNFFTDPNDPNWGSNLCRKLYHESLHFWQLLGWGYVANCAAADWQRIVTFETSGTVPPLSKRGLDSMFETGNHPFSPRELMEAVARFWDVHTRSPYRVMLDEQIPINEMTSHLTISAPDSEEPSYTNHAFDFVMQHGADCQQYAQPYRWLMDRVRGHSAFAVIMFPLCAHVAMGTPDPVTVFCEAIDLAFEHPVIQLLMNHRSGSIHTDWMTFWPALVKYIFPFAMAKAGVFEFTAGFDVIQRGGLRDHPIYRDYLAKATSLFGFFKLYHPRSTSLHPQAIQHAQDLSRTALENPYIFFALPGEPVYRLALGQMLAPPAVRFRNFTCYANRSVIGMIIAEREGRLWENTFSLIATEVEHRVARFRAAEYATSIGLPPHAFENSTDSK